MTVAAAARRRRRRRRLPAGDLGASPRARSPRRDVRVEPDLSNAGAVPRRGPGGGRHGPGARLADPTTQPGAHGARAPRAHGRPRRASTATCSRSPGRARSTGSTSTCTPPASSPRPSPPSPRSPTPPAGCAASRTCAGTRPTVSPRSRPRSPGSAGRPSRPATAWSSPRGRCAATSCDTYHDHRMATRGRPARAARARRRRSRTSPPRPRPCPTSPACGSGMLGAAADGPPAIGDPP